MGVMCQILLHRPVEGFYRPGNPVSGILKYAVDEATEYKEVKISLQGKGRCHWTESRSRGHGKDSKTESISYIGTEELVNMKMSVLSGAALVPVGSYEYSFKFTLPHSLPSSYEDLHCTINYSIKVKFERPGLFNFTKRFYTVITVRGVTPTATQLQPTSFDTEKTLIKLFRANQKINLKSTIQKTFFEAGESAVLNFEVVNNATVTPSVQVRLYEHLTYRSNSGRVKRRSNDVTNSSIKTPSVPETSTAILHLNAPTRSDLYSVNNSSIFSREYKLQVTLKLPMPHINVSRDIDVVINTPIVMVVDKDVSINETDSPPSYWTVMAEDDRKEEKE